MTLTEWLKRAQTRLEACGCPDPRVDARRMAEDALGLTPQQLLFEGGEALARDPLYRLESMLDRRCAGEPLQYILGTADFMGLRFHVAPGVLIPRQDTETLVEAALIDLRGRDGAPQVLDVCTGSGCIGLSLASLAPRARLTLSDASREALEIARENAKALGVEVEFRHGDLFEPLRHRRFDLIACNPPYIPRGQLDTLQREVRFEPPMALDGGEDGLDFYRRIAAQAPEHMNRGAALYLEVGAGQHEAVAQMLRQALPRAAVDTLPDLNGIRRVVTSKL